MKKQILVVLASLMMIGSTVPAYAAVIEAGAGKKVEQGSEETTSKSQQEINEAVQQKCAGDPTINWIVDPTIPAYELMAQYGTDEWWKAEAVEQARKWAEDNKDEISGIADEKARYEAIVTKVCDFLSYDIKYELPHIAYTIRDGKGVCADYTTLTKALCDINGIVTEVSAGTTDGGPHSMLKVTLNGHEYYSDPTNYDSGYAPMLCEGVPSYYHEGGTESSITYAAGGTGVDVSTTSTSVEQLSVPEGTVLVMGKDKDVHYVSLEDSRDMDEAVDQNDLVRFFSICDKYGITHY